LETEPLIGYWHFNDSGFSKVLLAGEGVEVDKGGAILRTNFANISEFQGDTLNALDSNAAGNSLSLVGDSNNGRYVELEFCTTGLKDISITFTTRGTGTGFNNHQWSYSVEGENFVEFGENTANTSANWQLKSVTLPKDADNTNSVIVRVHFDGATGLSGNNRIDNLQISGSY
jgi:hypothetical protein